MIFTGPNSGAAWGLSQILDAYQGIASLVEPVHEQYIRSGHLPLKILHGTAAHMMSVPEKSVDLVCMDPPYYDNVPYSLIRPDWQNAPAFDVIAQYDFRSR